MLEIAASLVICAMMARVVQGGAIFAGGYANPPRIDVESLRYGVLASLVALYLLDLDYGIALVSAVVMHEIGHVVAYRLMGHRDATFRLLPVLAMRPISQSAPRSEAHEFFIALMGAGFSIAPMVTAMLMSQGIESFYPRLATGLTIFASTVAALNFINLLPLWPLDGGRLLHMLGRSLCPSLTTRLLLGASAIAAAVALQMQSLQLVVICLLGIHALMNPEQFENKSAPMSHRTALYGLAAYVTITATHLVGGAWLLAWFFWPQ